MFAKSEGMFLSKIILPIVVVLFSSSVWADCQPVPINLLQSFFSNQAEWTEVEGHTSYLIAQNKPVFLQIDFFNPQQTTARWGRRSGGTIQSLCRISDAQLSLTVRHALAGEIEFVLTRHSDNLISSQSDFPGIGQYFYRPSHQVIESEETAEGPMDESLPSPTAI